MGREAELRQDVHGARRGRRSWSIPTGRIAHVWPKVKPEGHAADVLAALDAAQADGRLSGRGPDAGQPRGFARGGRRAKPRPEAYAAHLGPRKTIRCSRRRRRADAHTTGGPTGSWSSPPIPTMPSSGRPGRRRAGSTRARSAGWCAARAATRAARTRTPTRSSWPPCARRSSGRRPRSSATPACQLPAPARRRAGQRPGPARAARPRDPDVPAGRRPGDRPGDLFHGDGGVNHTDHRAAGLAAVDAVYPAARNPMAFPWLARDGLAAHPVRRLYLFWSNHAERLGRHLDDARSQARRPARAPQPDPRAGPPGRADPRVGGRGGRRGRARRRRGAAAHRHRRRPGERAELSRLTAGQRSSSRSGRSRPHWFQTSASPSARRPSIDTSSPRVRSPAAAGEVLVGGDGDVREQGDHLGLGRPVPDAHRVEAGVADGQRQVALGRDASVDPAAEPVEAVARARRGRPRCRGPGSSVNGPQNGWSSGKSQGRRGDAVGDDGVDEIGEGQLPAPALLGIVAGHGGDELGHRRAVAAQQPEDARRAARRPASRSARARRRTARPGDPSGRPARPAVASAAMRSSQSAAASRAATQAASAVSAAMRAASASTASRSSSRVSRRGRLALAGDGRRGVAGLAVDPVDLEQPGAGGGLDLVGRSRAGAVVAERRSGPASLAARTARGSAGRGGLHRRGTRGRHRRAAPRAACPRRVPAWARARVASSQRSSAMRRRSAHGPARRGDRGRDGRTSSSPWPASAVAAAASGPLEDGDVDVDRSAHGGEDGGGRVSAGRVSIGSMPPLTGTGDERALGRTGRVRVEPAGPLRPSTERGGHGGERLAGASHRRRHRGRRGSGEPNSRSTIDPPGAAAVGRRVGRPVRRGPARGRADEGVVGQGRRAAAGDRVLGDGHADLARAGGRVRRISMRATPRRQAEEQAHGQEAELADRHAARDLRSRGGPSARRSSARQRSCERGERQPRTDGRARTRVASSLQAPKRRMVDSEPVGHAPIGRPRPSSTTPSKGHVPAWPSIPPRNSSSSLSTPPGCSATSSARKRARSGPTAAAT